MKSKFAYNRRLWGPSFDDKKRNFITVYKKSVLSALLVLITSVAISQTLNSDKKKSIALKDTVKTNKSIFDQHELVPDSLFTETGKFKFYKKGAHASYYADKFHNHKTASGKKYDKNKYSAAHKKLPFGTYIRVTNEANGKSVVVEVIDRGPFVRSREIDLSRRAFMEISGNKSSGKMTVTLEILQK